MLTLICQISNVSGDAGWVGAGLLGLVLSWLFLKHLPAKDAQITELINEMVSALSEKDRAAERERDDFRKALDVVVKHCQEENNRLSADFKLAIETLFGADRVNGGKA